MTSRVLLVLLGVVLLGTLLTATRAGSADPVSAGGIAETRRFCIRGTSDGGIYRLRLTLPGVAGSPFTSVNLSLPPGSNNAAFRTQQITTINGFGIPGVQAYGGAGLPGGWACYAITTTAATGATGNLIFELTTPGNVFPAGALSNCACIQPFNPDAMADDSVGGTTAAIDIGLPQPSSLQEAQPHGVKRVWLGAGMGLVLLLLVGAVAGRRRIRA